MSSNTLTEAYLTKSGVKVSFSTQTLDYHHATDEIIQRLDSELGAYYCSNFEFPGRYTCWDIGFVNPALALITRGDNIVLNALNERGKILLAMVAETLKACQATTVIAHSEAQISLGVKADERLYLEEERSKKPSVFSVIRSLIDFFRSANEPYLGLYGAFGYDLIFQFESIAKKQTRSDKDKDMVLYFADALYIVDHRKEKAFLRLYDFEFNGLLTEGLDRAGRVEPFKSEGTLNTDADHHAGEYANTVHLAKEKFIAGELFEVVPSQTFYASVNETPSQIFKRLRLANPAPYGFFINLGEQEYLVGASPEMYVRVNGSQVETCPISGTIKRGQNAIEDAEQILKLLSSEKEKAELTMCTDVDRNDKSRICKPGSVKVIGRRQIEMYSRLIHTVDHVVGELREGFDAVDAFLTHMWVVTVTGAPKLRAMSFIEAHEKSSRSWYAGAVGWFAFNGDLNTGLTLRTIRIKEGLGEVRAGATLLFDSVPEEEEKETRLKALAMREILKSPALRQTSAKTAGVKQSDRTSNKTILLVDNDDSFVHTLANYFRQSGALVITTRDGLDERIWQNYQIDMICLSPGPGRPKDFPLNAVIDKAIALNLPLFGVCLGLQAIVEYFGGQLKVLPYPYHGKATKINHHQGRLFQDFEESFIAGRYHSLYADKDSWPKCLKMTASSDDGIVMALEHVDKPIYAVQFHPETILSLENNLGHRIIEKLIEICFK